MTTELILPARLPALDRLQSALSVALTPANEEQLPLVMLAVHEVCTNIVRHAYAGRDGEIRLRIRLISGVLGISIEDRAANPFAARHTGFESHDHLPEHGLGLLIVERAMDRVVYRRTEHGNRWMLLKRVATAADSGPGLMVVDADQTTARVLAHLAGGRPTRLATADALTRLAPDWLRQNAGLVIFYRGVPSVETVLALTESGSRGTVTRPRIVLLLDRDAPPLPEALVPLIDASLHYPARAEAVNRVLARYARRPDRIEPETE